MNHVQKSIEAYDQQAMVDKALMIYNE